MIKSAGLVIIYDGVNEKEWRILLVHPTNSPWMESYSIPKGYINVGESPLDAALRETTEEVGIQILKSDVRRSEAPFVLPYFDKNGNITKEIYYYFVIINDLKLLKIDDYKIQKNKLQTEEVDWAGFITFSKAERRILKKMKPILNQAQRFSKKNWNF